MKNLFSLDSPVFRFLTKLGTLIMLSLCWLVCCIPLVTIGAATAALLRSCFDLREDKGGIYRTFFKAFVSNLKLGTAVFLILGGGFFLLYCIPQLAAFIGSQMLIVLAIGITCALYLLLWLMLVCALPLVAYFDNTVEKTLRNALFVAIKDRRQSIPVAILAAVPVLLFLALPDVFLTTAAVWFLIYPGIVAYFTVCRFAPVFLAYGDRKKEKEEEKEKEETQNETI